MSENIKESVSNSIYHPYAEKYNAFQQELRAEKEMHQKEVSTLDKKITQVLHFIELQKFTDEQALILIGLLRELRVERRNHKNAIEDISVCIKGGKKSLPTFIQKKYKYSDELLIKIFGYVPEEIEKAE